MRKEEGGEGRAKEGKREKRGVRGWEAGEG